MPLRGNSPSVSGRRYIPGFKCGAPRSESNGTITSGNCSIMYGICSPTANKSCARQPEKTGGKARRFFRATPHNGARRFGQCFDPSESMENAGILDVFPIFHAARLGAKDPPKPAAPIVRCCLRQARVTERHPKEHNNKALTTGFWKKLSKGIFCAAFL